MSAIPKNRNDGFSVITRYEVSVTMMLILLEDQNDIKRLLLLIGLWQVNNKN